MKLRKKRWFTLVELIVVVTILAILWTIGFISYNGYLVWVRDSNRLTQLDQIASGLELYRAKNTLPLPTSNIRIESSGSLVWYQGYAWQDILDLIDYSKWGRDPKDGQFYTYYTTGDRKYYQLLWFLEDQTNQATSFLGINQAHAADYTVRFFASTGKRLWVLVDSFNTPIQESSQVLPAGATEFEMTSQTNTFTMIFSDKTTLAWNGTVIRNYNYNSNCKRIKESGGNKWDGIYTINPNGTTSYNAYCNMTYDGGGWTLAGRSVANQTVTPFGYSSNYGSLTDDTKPYSLAVSSLSTWSGIVFNDVMIGNYVSGKDLWDRIYKVSLPATNYSLSWATTTAVSVTTGSMVGLWKQCTGPSGGNGTLPTEMTYIWFATAKTNGFFISNTNVSWSYGLNSNGFAISANAVSCNNGLLNASGWVLMQWELFVR